MDSTAFAASFMSAECEKLLGRWRDMLKAVVNQLTDLLWQREQVRRLAAMIEANPLLRNSDKPFLHDALRWYSVFAVMSIRRQADRSSDVLSLRRVLVELLEKPECINRSMLVALFRANDGPRYDLEMETRLIDSMWKRFSNQSGSFDIEAVRVDLETLDTLSARLYRFASKTIAHTTTQGLNDEWDITFDELNECIDAFDEVTVKYHNLLTGAGMAGGTFLPTEQFNWYEDFKFAWKPDDDDL